MNKPKTILGLDLGPNSIGWALIEQNPKFQKKKSLTEARPRKSSAYSLIVICLSNYSHKKRK